MSNFDHAPLSQIFTKLIPFESHKYNKFMGSQPQHVSLNTLKPSIGICMVATKTYLEKWFNVASDFENIFLDKLGDVTIHLFTDQPELARVWASNNLKKVNFRSYEILSWGWPEVTLYRYKFFSEKSKYLTEDILMYLDSDMRILADFSTELEFEKWDSGIALVQHPGFHRNKGFAAILDFLCNPKLILSLVVKFFSGNKGYGTWELNPNSTAFVPQKHRRKYFHGAVWFGYRSKFLEMCTNLSLSVEKDLANKHIALWHDESHLNYYAAFNNVYELSPAFSGVEDYKHLNRYKFLIITSKKELGEGRSPTDFPTTNV